MKKSITELDQFKNEINEMIDTLASTLSIQKREYTIKEVEEHSGMTPYKQSKYRKNGTLRFRRSRPKIVYTVGQLYQFFRYVEEATLEEFYKRDQAKKKSVEDDDDDDWDWDS